MDSPPSSSSQYEDKPTKFGGPPEYAREKNRSETRSLASVGRIVETAASDWKTAENAANYARLQHYSKDLTARFLALVAECNLEYGYDSALDTFLHERLAENALATKDWLSSLFVRYIDDVAVVTGILRTVAHLDYDEVMPQGTIMALAALSHGNAEVKECGIRAFESWARPECLRILGTLGGLEPWLREYVDQVIADLKEEHKVDVTALTKD
ncbi:MAG: hypothetical protein IMZ44_02015 [Planctomycetes bacterium]|nr:hypothetical protein [Planctomycetota bacterium]